MPKKEKEEAIKLQTDSIIRDAQRLHGLTKKRKELQIVIREKEASLNHSISQKINANRAAERKKRMKLYGEVEEQRQQITSGLMLQFQKICEEDDVPRYVTAITQILDNFQGN